MAFDVFKKETKSDKTGELDRDEFVLKLVLGGFEIGHKTLALFVLLGQCWSNHLDMTMPP